MGINFFNKLFKKNNKLVVYTAIFGDYDNLVDPPKCSFCDFICFTDNKKLKSDVYKIILCKSIYLDSRKNAKNYKIRPHLFLPEYNFSIWIDGSIEIKTKKFYDFSIAILKKNKMAFLKHPERNCIYKEAEVCKKLIKDDQKKIDEQIDYYKKEGYPEKNGLVAGGVILRQNKAKDVITINDNWWKSIDQGSIRDQLSFNYVAWKNTFEYFEIKEYLWDNQYFKVLRHKR